MKSHPDLILVTPPPMVYKCEKSDHIGEQLCTGGQFEYDKCVEFANFRANIWKDVKDTQAKIQEAADNL